MKKHMNYKYTIRTDNESVFTNVLEIQDTLCWVEDLMTLYRIVAEGSEFRDLQPDAIIYENDRQCYLLCKIGKFDNKEMAFGVMAYNAMMLKESMKELETIYAELLEPEEDTNILCSEKLELPKTYLACYMFNYFGGDILDGKVINGAGINIAFRPYKNGKLVQFYSESETCFDITRPSRILNEGRNETIYFADLVQVSYDRENCYKLMYDEKLMKMMCVHFGWDKIDIQVESLYLFYQESEYISNTFECSSDVAEEFLRSHPEDFDISDNRIAQCPAYEWAEK